jgi:hypothetical protein
MTQLDPVRQLLSDRGCPEDVVAAGLDGLVARWSSIVASVETGYALGLDDLLNDLDTRRAERRARRGRAGGRDGRAGTGDSLDERLRAVSIVTGCLWGEDVEEDDGLTSREQWWYYRRPSRLNDDLAAELEAWGPLHGREDGPHEGHGPGEVRLGSISPPAQEAPPARRGPLFRT